LRVVKDMFVLEKPLIIPSTITFRDGFVRFLYLCKEGSFPSPLVEGLGPMATGLDHIAVDAQQAAQTVDRSGAVLGSVKAPFLKRALVGWDEVLADCPGQVVIGPDWLMGNTVEDVRLP
jgi:hypothetical protein